MNIAFFRKQHPPLINSKHRHRLRCCTPRLIQLLRWLSNDGSKAGHLTREEIQILLLAQRSALPAAALHALNAMEESGNA